MRTQEFILPEEHGKSAVIVIEKRLSPREQHEPEAVAHLRQEAALLRALGGRVTPRLVESGEDEHGPWLRMEKMAFPTLARRLEQAGGTALHRSWVALATRAAFEALAELHEARDDKGALCIVHADISPANLAIDDEGARAVLLDLELASWRGAPPRDGAFRGTIGYCAPEIARGEAPTVAGDLFALAAAILHASTGVVPRQGPSLAAVIAVAAERPLLDESRAAHLPAPIAQCLAHREGERPSSARAVLALLTSRELERFA